MEQLHQYVQAARQYGHTDEQIRSNLAAAGWHHAHIDTALGHNQPTLAEKPLMPNKRMKRIIIGLAGAVVVVLATAIGVGAYWHHDRYVDAHTQPSITFYYDDGKTILWQNTSPAQGGYSGDLPSKAPYFVFLAMESMQRKYGADYWKQGAWQVTTSLNANLQQTAEKLVADNYSSIQSLSGGAADEEATILQDVGTGQIKAYVGGVDFSNPEHGQNNYAALPHEPGTSVFPFSYADLIEHSDNAGAGTMVADTQVSLPGYPCTNKNSSFVGGNCLWDYDSLYPGNMSIRYALGGHRNVPAMQAIYTAAGSSESTPAVNQFTSLIRAMGANNGYNCYSDVPLTHAAQCYGNAVLGDSAFLSLADEAHALSTFANNGKLIPQTPIISIRLNGEVKSVWQSPAGKQAIRPDTAYIINNIMSDPNASYLPGSCTGMTCTGFKFQRYKGWDFAVDSGSTSNNFGALMASWSAKYVVASWVGNHNENVDLSAARGAASEYLVEPLTQKLMEAAHTNLAPSNWQQPKDIRVLPAYVVTNHIHYGDIEPSPATDLYPSWYRQS